MSGKRIDSARIIELYVNENKTQQEIVDILKVSKPTIVKYVTYAGYKMRTRTQATSLGHINRCRNARLPSPRNAVERRKIKILGCIDRLHVKIDLLAEELRELLK